MLTSKHIKFVYVSTILIIIISGYHSLVSFLLSFPSFLSYSFFLSFKYVYNRLGSFFFFLSLFLLYISFFRRIITDRPNRNVIWLDDLHFFFFRPWKTLFSNIQVCSAHLMMTLCQQTNRDDDDDCCCCCCDGYYYSYLLFHVILLINLNDEKDDLMLVEKHTYLDLIENR